MSCTKQCTLCGTEMLRLLFEHRQGRYLRISFHSHQHAVDPTSIRFRVSHPAPINRPAAYRCDSLAFRFHRYDCQMSHSSGWLPCGRTREIRSCVAGQRLLSRLGLSYVSPGICCPVTSMYWPSPCSSHASLIALQSTGLVY
jgi:hypothetical protein